MKIAARILSLMVLVALATFYVSCGGDGGNEKSDTDVQIEKLNGTWKVSSVTQDGAAPALNHDAMTLTSQGTAGNTTISFNVSGRPQGPSAWAPSGNLTFGSNVKQNLTRDDNVSINYSVTETTLVMDFTFNRDPYQAGRVSSVQGSWHFEFTKQ